MRDAAGRTGRDVYGRELESKAQDKVTETGDDALDERRREFIDWEEATRDDRENQQRDRDFYDGIQWTAEEIDELNERGQPIIVKNRIAPKVNYVLGTEIENRVDFRAYPRPGGSMPEPAHELDAEAVTDALRYKADEDRFDQVRSEVAQEVLIEGGPSGAMFAADGTEVSLTQTPWDRVYYDPHSRRFDFSDAQYMGLFLWMYEDELRALYPERQDEISAWYTSISGGQSVEDRPHRWVDHKLKRIQVFETFYRRPVKVGKETRLEWFTCTWTYAGFLIDEKMVEYVDEKGRTWCPLLLTSGFVTRENSRYGIVRNLISPQEEINKRSSKALAQISASRIIYEQNAILSPDEFISQLARVDGAAEAAPDAIKEGRLQVLPNSEMAAAQLGMLQESKAEIDQIGPHAALVAADQRQQSGRLYIARQQAGALEIKPIFDHLRHWTQEAGRRYWWLIRQFWTNEKWLRVRDDEGETGYRFVALNRAMTRAERVRELIDEHGHDPEDAVRYALGPLGTRALKLAQQKVQQAQAQQEQMAQAAQQVGQPFSAQQLPDPLDLLLRDPIAQERFTAADIPRLDVDIMLDLTPDSAIVQHEQFSEFAQIVKENPLLGQNMQVLKGLIQMSSLRDKRRVLAMLEPKTDPAVSAMQDMQSKLQIAQLQATVAQLQAQADATKAEAAKLAQQAAVEPTRGQLNQAQAALAIAKAQSVPHEAALKQAQTLHTAVLAGRESVPDQPQAPTGAQPQQGAM